jgi:hypothetical protein
LSMYVVWIFIVAAGSDFIIAEREDGKGAGDKENASRAHGPSEREWIMIIIQQMVSGARLSYFPL